VGRITASARTTAVDADLRAVGLADAGQQARGRLHALEERTRSSRAARAAARRASRAASARRPAAGG